MNTNIPSRIIEFCCSAAVAAVLFTGSADATETIALYTFENGVAGEAVTAESVTNMSGAVYATTVGAIGGEDGSVPVYSDVVPGKYIYGGITKSGVVDVHDLVCANPKSVLFQPRAGVVNTKKTGGYVKLAELGSAIGNSESFTLEAFVQFDASYFKLGGSQEWTTPLVFSGGQVVKFCNLNANYLGIQNVTRQWLSDNQIWRKDYDFRGIWCHVAVTCNTSDRTIKYYFDHEYVGEIEYVNHEEGRTITGQEVVLGSSIGLTGETFHGLVTCLRVTPSVLPTDKMLYASDIPPAQEGIIALYSGQGATEGTAVESLVNEGADGFAGIGAAVGAGQAPQYDADIPGKYIYAGLGSSSPLVTDPLSFCFFGDSSDPKKGSCLSVPGLSNRLFMEDEWTIECFWKVSDGNVTWRDFFCATIGQSFKAGIMLENKRIGIQETYSYKDPKTVVVTKDDKWHHFAVTYRASSTGSELEGWVDYRSVGTLPLARTTLAESQPVVFGAKLTANGETFPGKLCCIRVSDSALSADQFEVAAYTLAKPAAEGTVFHWRFEGVDGESLETVSAEPIDFAFAQGFGTSAYGAPLPRRARAVRLSGREIWSGDESHRACLIGDNASCAEFFGRDNMTHTDEWAGSCLSASSLTAQAHPKTFSYEFFVKTRNDSGVYPQLLAGCGIFDNEYDWRLTLGSVAGGLGFACKTKTGGTFSASVDDAGLSDGKWHHVALTYDDTTAAYKIYIDYEIRSSGVITDGLQWTKGFYYRNGRYCGCRGFNGYLDEIRVSSRALGCEEFLHAVGGPGFQILIR